MFIDQRKQSFKKMFKNRDSKIVFERGNQTPVKTIEGSARVQEGSVRRYACGLIGFLVTLIVSPSSNTPSNDANVNSAGKVAFMRGQLM